jgi:hypothetical protein
MMKSATTVTVRAITPVTVKVHAKNVAADPDLLVSTVDERILDLDLVHHVIAVAVTLAINARLAAVVVIAKIDVIVAAAVTVQ